MPPRSTAVGRAGWPPGTFIARLAPETGAALLALSTARQYLPGSYLLQQGEAGTQVYLLQSSHPDRTACVKVTAALENGSEALLGIRVSGDIVGELSGLRDGRRTATVTMCTPAIVHAIQGPAFQDFLRRHLDAWNAMSSMIADRLVWANQRRLDFAGYETSVRLARVLVELVDRHGVHGRRGYELGVNLSHTELGMLIGARKDAASAAMRQLRDEGAVALGYRDVTITDLGRLRTCALLGE